MKPFLHPCGKRRASAALSWSTRRMLAAALFGIPSLPAPLAAREGPWDFNPDSLRGFPAGPERDDIVPGELIVDAPTLENLGFRWYVEGDSNLNATVGVSYRLRGADVWNEGLPMLRVHHELVERADRPYRTGNLFAGSVFFLESGREYEVRLTMHDPDGGAPAEPKLLTATTRSEPTASEDGRILNVYPPNFGGARESKYIYGDLAAALEAARPGDIIFLHPGVHRQAELEALPPLEVPAGRSLGSRTPARAVYNLSRSGTAERPIVIRGAGRDHSIIEGPDQSTDLFRVAGVKHVIFEDLTLRGAHTAIRGSAAGRPGASWLTVLRCGIEQVINGAWTTAADSRGWLFTDNVITGIDPEWYPRTTPERDYMDGSHTGINVYGSGHVIRYNRISRFSDSLAIANVSNPSPDRPELFPVAIDFHNNDLSFAIDDTIEADYGGHNIRIYQNLCYNTHTALSVQPSYGGPVYLIRNVAYGITGISYKWNNHPSGILAYHNTTVSAASGFSSPPWSNSHLRNNLILGAGSKIRTGTFTPDRSTLDHNGYRGGAIHWTVDRGERRTHADLSAFTAASGHERNGMEVDFHIFVKAGPVEKGKTYQPSDFDLRLVSGAAPVDAGQRLPNINDNHSGDAPDLGAYERNSPLPHYGPRKDGASGG